MSDRTPVYTLRQGSLEELPQAVALDDAAAELFRQAGLDIDLPEHHPFVVAERASWQRALAAGHLWFACSASQPIGFCALEHLAGSAYLEQLSVHPDHGRRGVGTRLLDHVCSYSRAHGDRELWLTTYAHLPWNRPYYERHGFQVVATERCTSALQVVLEEQRAVLPAPEQRIVMCRVF